MHVGADISDREDRHDSTKFAPGATDTVTDTATRLFGATRCRVSVGKAAILLPGDA